MTEPFEIYSFYKGRNKCSIKRRSDNELKKLLKKKYGLRCYLCSKEFDRDYNLEKEHKIPVEIGGKIFCLTNLNFVCVRCHRKKTDIDKKVIKIIKDLGIIINGTGGSFWKLEEIAKIYFYLFDIVKENKKKYEIWFNGNPEIDYKQINDLSNREVLE